MEHRLRLESEELLRVKRKQLEKADNRFKELDRQFIRLYEDNVLGKLSDERFSSKSRNYEEEQETLKEEMEILCEEIELQEQQMENLELFIQKVKEHTEMEKLTSYAAHEPIRAIYVGAPDKSSGKRQLSIQICYDLVGFIPLDELMKQETV